MKEDSFAGGDLFGGAAAGAVFQELIVAVIAAIKSAAMFRGVLEELRSTLSSIEPIVKEIDSLNKVLDKEHETKQFKEIINQGQKLVEKCSKIQKWNFYKRSYHTQKLRGLMKSLERFCSINIQAQQIRDIKETLIETKDIGVGMRRLSSKEGSSSGNGMLSKFAGLGCCEIPEPPGRVVGFDAHLKELKLKLLNDGVSVIVVSAPGGSGKTTLVKQLCRDEQVKGKFEDNIFYVTVAKAPNREVILRKLLQLMGYGRPEFQSEEDALNQLEQTLRRKATTNPILLILDDVWSESEYLVDKLNFTLPDYKILITSRFVFQRFDSTYCLKPLNDDDAMTLFRHSAFLQNGNTNIPEDVVNKVMKSCKGIPLALEVVGRSLCRQPVAVWQSRAKQQSKGKSILHFSSDMLDSLQSSFYALDGMKDIQDCFLDLGSFPEDHMIPANALIDMWVEQYKLDEDNDAFCYLYVLYTRNLVELVVRRNDDASEADGCYNDHFIRQHDLLRELAIYQSSLDPVERRKRLIVEVSGNKFPIWWLEEKQQPLGAQLLSISTDERFSFNWGNLHAPEVEVLVLNFRTKTYTLPVFLEKMDKLKVLIVMNNGIYPTELSNFLLLCSLSNLSRIRLEKVSLPSLGLSFSPFKNLRKLSLVMCNIGQAFKSTNKMSDVFPNLLEIDIDYCNDLEELTDGLCDLVQLVKLSITNCHNIRALPEGIGSLVNLKVLRLTSCTELQTLPKTIGSLSQLEILDISDCLSIVDMPNEIGELHNLSKLYMRGCSSSDLPSTVTKLQNLEEVICEEETAYQWDMFKLTNLRVTIYVEDVNLNWLQTCV